LEMSGNRRYLTLLCIAGLKNVHSFHVAGDCRDLLEGRSSWEGGDSWDMKAATMGSPHWNLLLEFDRPLKGLQVFNGELETEDMKQFKITPEKYLKYHTEPVDVNFLADYESNLQPAILQYINVNGKTHECKEGLGDGAGIQRSGGMVGRGGAQFRTNVDLATVDYPPTNVNSAGLFIKRGSSQVSCDSSKVCTRTNTLIFEKELTAADCPADALPEACDLLLGSGANRLSTCTTQNADKKALLTQFCYKTCFCTE